MQRTRIEWVRNPDGSQGYSWNPIKGLCPGDCRLPDGRSYCYGRENYKRFHRDENVRLDLNDFKVLRGYTYKGVFVCSTFDLFHPITNSPCPGFEERNYSWRDLIFHVIKNTPKYRFYILTKFPQNIDRSMPDNVWLGYTVTDMRDYLKIPYLEKEKARIKFLSFEPLLYDGEYPLPSGWSKSIDWIIIGKLTGFGKKYNPHKEQIDKFVRFGERFKKPIFLKGNLKEIWGEPLIQEFPQGG